MLYIVNIFGRKGISLRNIYLPAENGKTSEIDLLYITQKGIFVFESKNYSGWIFGDEAQYQWTSSLPNGDKHRFYNPIRQNKTHIKWLQNYLKKDIPMFSMIVFSERCELKKITVETPDVHVFNRDETYWVIRKIWESKADVLSENEIREISEKLSVLTEVDETTKRTHVEQIQKDALTCPRCGGKLVLRTAKQGASAGTQFYGCSNYPNCKFTKNAT
jgi:ssDNA-binding Zn-finger/Zn-ribbon topoisomerase 1